MPARPGGALVAVVRTADEISGVCDGASVPTGASAEPGWAVLRVRHVRRVDIRVLDVVQPHVTDHADNLDALSVRKHANPDVLSDGITVPKDPSPRTKGLALTIRY